MVSPVCKDPAFHENIETAVAPPDYSSSPRLREQHSLLITPPGVIFFRPQNGPLAILERCGSAAVFLQVDTNIGRAEGCEQELRELAQIADARFPDSLQNVEIVAADRGELHQLLAALAAGAAEIRRVERRLRAIERADDHAFIFKIERKRPF